MFLLLTSVFMPLLVATVAYYMYKAGNQPGSLLYVSLGAAVYGIWSSTLFGSGGAIQWQRWQGTLEVLVSAPTPFVLVIAPLTLATSVIGIYSLASTLVWGRLVFGIPFHVVHWLAFVVAVPATILGLGLLGFVFASTFVLYRNANALSNMLEWPVLLVTGMLVPLSLLPGWAGPIAWLRPDLGRAGDSRGGDRRHAVAGRRHDDLARARVPGDRCGLPPPLRDGGTAARDPVPDVRAFVRVFFVGGVIAYRGLFNWIRPAMYIPTMLIGPVFQILFFAYSAGTARWRTTRSSSSGTQSRPRPCRRSSPGR